MLRPSSSSLEYYARTNDEANAKAHYNKAIEASFASAGVEGAAEHIAQFPFDMANYKKSIGVQKWIALAGVNTFEAWCELRRLDYPAFDTTKKGSDFYTKGDDGSFTDSGYQAGTLYTPIDVFSQVAPTNFWSVSHTQSLLLLVIATLLHSPIQTIPSLCS